MSAIHKRAIKHERREITIINIKCRIICYVASLTAAVSHGRARDVLEMAVAVRGADRPSSVLDWAGVIGQL